MGSRFQILRNHDSQGPRQSKYIPCVSLAIRVKTTRWESADRLTASRPNEHESEHVRQLRHLLVPKPHDKLPTSPDGGSNPTVTRHQATNGRMLLAKSPPDLMQRLPCLPPTPHVEFLLR